MKIAYALVLLFALGLAPTMWGANNPDIVVGMAVGGREYLQLDKTTTLRATLVWPDGTPLSSGIFTWSASPANAVSFNQTSQPGSTISEVDITGASPALTTITVHWEADRSGYSSPDATLDVLVLDLKVEVNEQTLTLMDQSDWEAKVLPAGYAPNRVRFQVVRPKDALGAWVTIPSENPVKTMTHRVAGTFDVRCMVDIDAVRAVDIESANIQTIRVGFPVSADIAPQARLMMIVAWGETLFAATPTSRREQGFFITLDTATGAYGQTVTTYGTPVGPLQVAEWDTAPSARPADSIREPVPYQDAPTYAVAWFHTHTPNAYQATSRGVGPSGGDAAYSMSPSISVPGYVYDYIPVSGNEIPPFYPLESPATVSPIPPDVRALETAP